MIEYEDIEDLQGAAIAVERTPDFFQVAQQLSDFIKELPLDQPTNDRLIALMVEQVHQAEEGAFSQGFRMGCEFSGHETRPTRRPPEILQ